MKWLITKNPIRLALSITLLNFGIGIILSLIQRIANIDFLGAFAGLIAIYIVGSGYATQYQEIMDEKLRQNTAGYFCIGQYILAFVAYFLMKIKTPIYHWFIIITIVTAVLFFLTKWLLKRAGMTVIKPKAKV